MKSQTVEITVDEQRYDIRVPITVSRTLPSVLICLVNKYQNGMIGYRIATLNYQSLHSVKYNFVNLRITEFEIARTFPNHLMFNAIQK